MRAPRRLLFSLITLCLFLLLAEAGARLLPGPGRRGEAEPALRFGANPELLEGNEAFWQPDPGLFWRMRPNLDVVLFGERVHTNAAGFRDGPHPTAPVPGRPLIACLGDSTTFGWKVRQEDRFSDLLPGLLAAGGEPAPLVLNFGQTGYSTVQAGRLLEREVLPLSPAVVVLVLGANDYGMATGRTDARQPWSAPGGATGGLQRALGRSAFYRRLAGALGGVRDRVASPHEARDATGVLRRVPEEEFARRLQGLVEAVRRSGARPVLATYPRRPLNPLLSCPVPAPDAIEADWRAWDAAIQADGAALREQTAAVLALPARPAEPALEIWQALPAWMHERPAFHYGRAYILQRAGRGDEAAAALVAAGEAAARPAPDPAHPCEMDLFSTALFRYRDQPVAARYNALIAQVAARTGTPLVDVEALLARAQRDLVAGVEEPARVLELWFGPESYFADVVHPSERGHALMAAALAGALRAGPGDA